MFNIRDAEKTPIIAELNQMLTPLPHSAIITITLQGAKT